MRHLHDCGCRILREGGNHTIVINLLTRKKAPVPRHAEVHEILARKICVQLGARQP